MKKIIVFLLCCLVLVLTACARPEPVAALSEQDIVKNYLVQESIKSIERIDMYYKFWIEGEQTVADYDHLIEAIYALCHCNSMAMSLGYDNLYNRLSAYEFAVYRLLGETPCCETFEIFWQEAKNSYPIGQNLLIKIS